MLKWLDKQQPAVLFVFCLLLIFHTSAAVSATNVLYEISDIKTIITDKTLTYTISGSAPPVYTVSERFTPFRVVLDIAGGTLAQNLTPEIAKVPDNSFASITVSELKDQQPPVMRFELTLNDSHDYTVTTESTNLIVKVVPAAAKVAAPQSPVSIGHLTLKDLQISSTPNSTTISILASNIIEKYKVDTVASSPDRPPRMYIDIDDVASNELVREKQIGTSVAKVRVAPREKGVRLVFDSATSDLFKYSVMPSAEGLNVVIDETAQKGSLPSTGQVTTKNPSQSDSTLDALIDSSEQLIRQEPVKATQSASSLAASLEDDFSFSGYKKQRISVDFYKIDIHNVFRLFRQITDMNIIVDETVQGSLTLALNNVPWDFALDIILNLMDLKKEERFNTIVIYPSKKAFVWPTRAEDNLAVKADVEVIQKEALVVEKAASLSQETAEAKNLIANAAKLEDQQSFEDAALLYAKALELWPDNAPLSNRLAAIYLVNLGMNAKAVFYAKKTLEHDPANTRAALYAAIGSANMQRINEASEFFGLSLSGTPPLKEALISYAAFSENNGQNEAALKLLDKYQANYGETIDTMIAKARILDKLARSKDAAQQYKAILSSGYQLRPDLKKYIEGRLAAKDLR